MKLTPEEVEAVKAGATELRRKVRHRRHGKRKAFKSSIRRGQLIECEDLTLSVVSVRREGEWWRIQVEQVGHWAASAKTKPTLSLEALEDELPGALVWQTEPDVEVGDIFVFEWHKIRDPNAGGYDRKGKWREGGDPISLETPAVYVEITSLIRGKKGEYVAHYEKHGFDEIQYLAPKAGYTTNRSQAIAEVDGTRAAVLPLRHDREISERDAKIREYRRLQQLRAAHQAQLVKAKGPGRAAVAAVALADVERQIEALVGPEMEDVA